jgi:O-antigen/teichoic acid export membrane protein
MHKNEEKKSKSTYDHVIKYTGLFGGVQGLGLLASIVRNKLVAEILGPAGLGLISLYNTAATLVSNSTNFGISFSAVRHISELYEQGDADALQRFIQVVRAWSIGVALLGMLVCGLFSPLLSASYFDDMSHWYSFVWLSPVVGLLALTGGELAILKGTRCLRRVALQSLINSLGALLISVPLYYFWGEKAIIASLVLVGLCTFVTTFYFSTRSYPISFRCGIKYSFVEGKKMISLGVAFILAGILGSGVEFLIRAYMVQTGSEADVGMYSAGYLLTVTYASIIFTAMETDFFPRLSAVNNDIQQSNQLINRQIEASVLLVSPMLVALWVAFPILLSLFYNEEFMPVIGMAQCAIFGLYMRSVALPISYLSLAKGRSRVYLFTEAVYDVAAVSLIVCGYSMDGLRGAGAALSLAAAFDLLLVWITAHKLYGFSLHGKALKILSLQLLFGFLTYGVTVYTEGVTYWLLGCLCFLASGMVSVRILLKETTLLQSLVQKVKNRLGRK